MGTQNDTAGGGVWDYDGSTWTQANTAGFGDTNNKRCYGLEAYNDHLYVGTKNSTGTQVWRNNAPVLEVIKSAVPTQVNAGGTIDYSIAVTNSGDADATDVLLTDQIPQYTSVVTGSCTCSDPGATINSENPVNVSGITVAQSATVTVAFSVGVDADVPDATLISNQAFVQGDGVTTPSSDPQHPGLGQPTLVLARRAAPVKPAGSKTWYLAEGSTGSDESGSFESWILVQNAGNVAAGVDLYYQTPAGEVAGPHLNLAPHTRQTVNVAETVPNQWSVSTRVVSNNPVIAERAMYWNSSTGVYREAADDSIGVSASGKTWYLAEGSTGSDESGSFESWILVQNAGNVAAGVDLYYQTPAGEVAGPHLNLAPHTRQTVNVAETVPNQWSVSTRVVSNNPVIAERAMYWNSSTGVYRQAATDSIGFDP